MKDQGGSAAADAVAWAPRWPRSAELVALAVVVLGGLLATGVAASAPRASWSQMGSTINRSTERVATDGEPARDPAIGDDGWLVSATVSGTWSAASAELPPSIVLGPIRLGGLATVASSGEPSVGPALTSSPQWGPGRDPWVAFASTADDLPGADADAGCVPHGGRCADVFFAEVGLRGTWSTDPPTVVLVSDGPGTGGADSHTPALANEDRIVAFTSEGLGLTVGDEDSAADVYVGEVDGSGSVVLERVSLTSDGAEITAPATSTGEAISADGRFVVFTTAAPLDVADTNTTDDVYLRDRLAGTTSLISLGPNGSAVGDSGEAAISADGSAVAFTSGAPVVADGVPGGGERQVYVHHLGEDGSRGAVVIASQVPGGPAGDGASREPALSDDGSRVGFTTSAGNVVRSAAGPLSAVVEPVDEVVVVHLQVPAVPSASGPGALEVLAPTRLGGVDGLVRSSSIDLGRDRIVLLTDVPLRDDDEDATDDVYWMWVAPPWCDPGLIQQGPGQFCAEISWAMRHGLLGLYDGEGFAPTVPVSRQALAAVTYRSAGSPLGEDPACSAPPFPDVPVGAAFCGEIAWMASEGITTGYPDGSFRPAAPVSRQAMLAFLWRQAGQPSAGGCPSAPFVDVPSGHAFCEAISWGVVAGLTEGYVDGTFRTTAPLSRQAATALLFRLALHEGRA